MFAKVESVTQSQDAKGQLLSVHKVLDGSLKGACLLDWTLGFTV